MNGLNKAEELSQIEGNIEAFLKNDEFRKELVFVLLSGLRRFGFTKSLKLLEEESGLALPSGFSAEFKDFVLQGRFDQALGTVLPKRLVGRANERRPAEGAEAGGGQKANILRVAAAEVRQVSLGRRQCDRPVFVAE